MSLDVEAQEEYSQGQEEEEPAPDVTSDHDHLGSTFMRPIAWLVHYIAIELFKSGANHSNHDVDSDNSTGYYSATGSPQNSDDVIRTHEDAEVVETYVDIDEDENKEEHNIELQSIQRNNITKIVKDKDLEGLHSFGGVRGVAEALNTDLENGISSDQEYILQPKRNQKSRVSIILYSFLGAWKNYTLFLLFVAAALSLTLGIKKQGLTVYGLKNGVIIIGTILFIVVIKTVRNYLQERSSVKYLETYWSPNGKGNHMLKSSCNSLKALVTRGGNKEVVPVIDLMVGDLVHLKKGCLVPADGIYIGGETVQVYGELRPTIIDETNPFLFYGLRVINGNASMIVTSVDVDTVWGEMMSQGEAPTKCGFVASLLKVRTHIQVTGIVINILINIAHLVCYALGKNDDNSDNGFKTNIKGVPMPIKTMDEIAGILTLFVVIHAEAIEFIAVVISNAVFYWNLKTLTLKGALVTDYLSCVKMASVTTIVTDKLGGLTEHEVEIDKFLVGEEFISESSQVASYVLEGLCDGVGTLLLISPNDRDPKLVSMKSWFEAKIGLRDEYVDEHCKILKTGNPFEEICGVEMEKIGHDGSSLHLHYKGPPLKILSLCSEYYDSEGNIHAIDLQKRRKFKNVIRHNLVELEVVAFASRQKIVTESDGASLLETNSLTLLGMIALKYTKKEVIKKAVLTLKEGGIRTILASGDDVGVLQTIGEKCGLISPNSDGLMVTAEEYRKWNDEEKKDKVGKICIVGNCLPSDKIDLVKRLKEKGEVVAMSGQLTFDAPAQREADIGLAFGSWSSEVARESSGITILNGDFSFLVHVIEIGKSIHENTRKFIQLQLISTYSSLVIKLFSTFTTIQLIRLSLVHLILGGLAVLIGQPIGAPMDIVPINSSGRLITKDMYRNIFIQAFYQIAIVLTLEYKGQAVFGISGVTVKSMIYTGICLCQFLNIFIARDPKSKNIFKGLFRKNRWFFGALVLYVFSQAMLLMDEKNHGGTPFLNLELNGVCLLMSLVSVLLDFFGKVVWSFVP